MNNQTIGRNITRFRKLQEIKAYDIAQQLGISESAYTKYERGQTEITINFIQKIASILGVTEMQILSADPTNFLSSLTNNYGGNIQSTNSPYHGCPPELINTLTQMMQTILDLNNRMLQLIEKISK